MRLLSYFRDEETEVQRPSHITSKYQSWILNLREIKFLKEKKVPPRRLDFPTSRTVPHENRTLWKQCHENATRS